MATRPARPPADRPPANRRGAQQESLLLSVRAQPRARREEVAHLGTAEDGTVRLKVAVRAVPEDGRANQAVCDLLAAVLGLPRSAVTLCGGASSREKRVRADGDPHILRERLQSLAKQAEVAPGGS